MATSFDWVLVGLLNTHSHPNILIHTPARTCTYTHIYCYIVVDTLFHTYLQISPWSDCMNKLENPRSVPLSATRCLPDPWDQSTRMRYPPLQLLLGLYNFESRHLMIAFKTQILPCMYITQHNQSFKRRCIRLPILSALLIGTYRMMWFICYATYNYFF